MCVGGVQYEGVYSMRGGVQYGGCTVWGVYSMDSMWPSSIPVRAGCQNKFVS